MQAETQGCCHQPAAHECRKRTDAPPATPRPQGPPCGNSEAALRSAPQGRAPLLRLHSVAQKTGNGAGPFALRAVQGVVRLAGLPRRLARKGALERPRDAAGGAAPGLGVAAGVPHEAARQGAGGLAVLEGRPAGEQRHAIALNVLRPTLLALRQVVGEVWWKDLELLQIDDIDVCLHSSHKHATVAEAKELRHVRRLLPHQLFNRQLGAARPVARPMGQ
mmetsp:Transcript_115405/g.337463  ORF Transcript_115405/g.337463 Transcript_115405/m.337463 type:complete len:220 (-) Transcript_115405:1475-2134(-)